MTDTQADPGSDPTVFQCDCLYWQLNACRGETFYSEFHGKRFCILHYPLEKDQERFNTAIKRKLKAEDFDFSGVYFSEAVNFKGQVFTGDADFSGATFKGKTDFSSAQFRGTADFRSAAFASRVSFDSVWFQGEVVFSDVNFNQQAVFAHARFEQKAGFQFSWFHQKADFGSSLFQANALFNSTDFKQEAYFYKAKFEGDATFSSAKVAEEACFYGAKFHGRTEFDSAKFSAPADFNAAEFKSEVNFEQAEFTGQARFFSTQFAADADFKMSSFKEITNFISSSFARNANFSYAKFASTATFANSVFATESEFSMASFNGETDFASSQFGSNAHFSQTIFGGKTYFSNADFQKAANFVSAIIKDNFIFIGKTLSAENAKLDLGLAVIEKPERVSFRECKLRPEWFLLTDPRKFEFDNVEWVGLQDELKRLKAKGEWNHKQHHIVYRQLATNAEENHRYAEASQFRFASLEARRLERFRGFVPWRLEWWYWLASCYGESVGRAFLVFAAIIFLFTFGYTRVGFDHSAKTSPAIRPLEWKEAAVYSLNVSILQKPEPKPFSTSAKLLVWLETVLGPAQAAFLALAVRRRFMR